MHNFYKKYRVLHEPEILTKIVLPICSSMIPKESEPSVQYYLINVLFDAAKLATIKVGAPNELFMNILSVVGSVFNNGINLETGLF